MALRVFSEDFFSSGEEVDTPLRFAQYSSMEEKIKISCSSADVTCQWKHSSFRGDLPVISPL
jgi:hypothetical protein